MKRRSNFQIMGRLVGLVKPLIGFMILAIVMGVIGFLAAISITVFGGYAMLDVLQMSTPITLKQLWYVLLFLRWFVGFLRYAEQACNHFIAFNYWR